MRALSHKQISVCIYRKSCFLCLHSFSVRERLYFDLFLTMLSTEVLSQVSSFCHQSRSFPFISSVLCVRMGDSVRGGPSRSHSHVKLVFYKSLLSLHTNCGTHSFWCRCPVPPPERFRLGPTLPMPTLKADMVHEHAIGYIWAIFCFSNSRRNSIPT